MDTKLIIALVAFAAAGTAQAQSNVNIYGILDVAVAHIKPGDGSPSLTRLDPGVGYGSRLGFRGSEDLGGGLKGNFLMEMGFAPDTGTSQQGGALFGRQVYVGLGSNRWSISMGRQYSPLLVSMATVDATGQGYWGNTQGAGMIIYQSPRSVAGDGGHQATVRVNNSVLGTWKADALTIRGMLAAGDENTAGTGRLAGFDVQYVTERLTLAAAANRYRQYAKEIPSGSKPGWEDEWLVGAVYNLDNVKLFAGYYKLDPSESNKTVGATTLLDTKSYWLGARVPVGGAGTVIAQAMRSSYGFIGTDGKATTLSLAYEHALSKRTVLYTSYGQVNNSAAGIGTMFSGTTTVNAAGVAGADPKALSVGMRHQF